MNISSLSIQAKKRLIELLEDLFDIKNRKESLIENADKEIDRMSKIDDMQSKLDEKGTEFTSILTPMDARELQNLIEKSDKLSSEKEEINIKSKQIYDDLEELESIENSLMEEINDILSSTNQKEESKSIYVETLNTEVYIVDKKITENIEKIDAEKCEIINCNIELIAEIAKSYRSHINKIVLETTENMFDELKEKVEKYKNDKNSSYDKQLELLRNSFNEQKNNEKEEIEVKDEPVKEETINETLSEPIVSQEISTTINEQPVINETLNNEPTIIDNNETAVSLEPVNLESNGVNELPIQNDNQVVNENIDLSQPEPIESIVPEENNTTINELPKQEDSVVPLSSLLDQQLMMSQEQPVETPIQQNSLINSEESPKYTRYVNIDDDYKIVPSKETRATKDKLRNKITDICWGSFEPRGFIHFSKKNESLENFNFNDFANNKAA